MLQLAHSLTLILLFPFPAFLQDSETGKTILTTLDSIRGNGSASGHFAHVYYETTSNAINFYSGNKVKNKPLIERFEWKFAEIFFRAANAHHKGQPVLPQWSYYFSGSDFSPLQYTLIGINTHINEDIWQALTAGLSREELKEIRSDYISFYPALKEQYFRFYRQAWKTHNRIRLLHVITLGLDVSYGTWLLKKWRMRQFRLAEMYCTGNSRFHQKLARTKKKAGKLNLLIAKYLH